jgi:hypothetical protein
VYKFPKKGASTYDIKHILNSKKSKEIWYVCAHHDRNTIRSRSCTKEGPTSADRNGNTICKECRNLYNNESFRRCVRRASASTTGKSHTIRERGNEETKQITNARRKRARALESGWRRARKEHDKQKVLGNALKGKINFKKIAKAMRMLDADDRTNIAAKESADMPQGMETSTSSSSSSQSQAQEMETDKPSVKKKQEMYSPTAASRSLKIQFMSDILSNLMAHDKRTNRHSEKAKKFFKIIRLVGGPQVYRILEKNLDVPGDRTLRRDETNPPWLAGFSERNWLSIKKAYEAVRDGTPGIQRCIVLSAEDETGIRPEPGWCPRSDTITGLCGIECARKCEKVTACRAKGLCDPVHQCMSYEHVFVVGSDDGAYDRIKELCETFRKGKHLRIMVLNPLDKRWPQLVCAHFDTCNAFDAAKYVNTQWRQVEVFYRKYIEDIVGPLVGFSSDGDSRRRKLMLHYAMGANPKKLMCLCCNPAALLPMCVRKPYGLEHVTFTLKAWKFTITDKESGDVRFRIRYIGDQDYIHCGKKLINCTAHPSRDLRIGPHMYAHMNAITTNMNTQTREEHGLVVGDDSRHMWRAMDWPSAVRLMTRKHLTSLENLCEGHNDLIPNEGVRGMLEYLKIVRMYTSIYADRSLSHTERVKRAGCVVTYLRLWKCYVQHDQGLDNDIHFITRESFQDCLLSCHALVLLIMANRDLTPEQVLDLARAGTDCCEDFFSFAGSSVANKRVYSTLETRHTIHNHLSVHILAALGGIILPKSTKNRRQIFDHEGEGHNGPEQWGTDAALLRAWLQGVKMGYARATAHGMRPNNYRNVPWWTRPEKFCDANFKSARGDGIDDDWGQDEEEDDDSDEDEDISDDHDGPESSDNDESDGDSNDDGEGECLQAAFVGNDNAPSVDGVSQTVYVPHLKKHVHKATVIRDLTRGEDKVSADRVVRNRNLTKSATVKATEMENNNLGKEDWFVGIDTDVAVKVYGDDGEMEIEIGRVKRIVRIGQGKKKKKIEYKRRVKLSTKKDRDQHHKNGVRFYCHFYRRVGAGRQQVYEFGTNPFTTVIETHMIVSPVAMNYEKGKKWKLNQQSTDIVKLAKEGQTIVPVYEYIYPS